MIKKGLLAFVGLASAAPTDETCSWVGGTYGQPLQCPDGYMVQGVCGSGQSADCNGYHTEMYRTKLKFIKIHMFFEKLSLHSF